MPADIELRKLTKAIEAQTRAIEKQNRLIETVNDNLVEMYRAFQKEVPNASGS